MKTKAKTREIEVEFWKFEPFKSDDTVILPIFIIQALEMEDIDYSGGDFMEVLVEQSKHAQEFTEAIKGDYIVKLSDGKLLVFTPERFELFFEII